MNYLKILYNDLVNPHVSVASKIVLLLYYVGVFYFLFIGISGFIGTIYFGDFSFSSFIIGFQALLLAVINVLFARLGYEIGSMIIRIIQKHSK
jgi:hypothetical protein